MKRKSIITVLALVLVLALSLSIFSACNKKHKYSSEWKFDEKNHWHECTTKKHTDTSEKLPHEFKEEIVKAADYGVVGEKKFTCEKCGYSYTQDIDALGAKDNEIKLAEGKTLGKEYDGKVVDTTGKFSFNGNGAVTVMFKVTGAADDTYTETAPKNAGKYTVKVSVAATAEWKAATQTFDFEIAKKELTGASATKMYDGNVTIVATPDGVVAGDEVTATITMDSKNVGATVQSVMLDGAGKDNYVIDKADVVASITPKKISVEWEPPYDNTNVFSGEPAGMITGDEAMITVTMSSANVGATVQSLEITGKDAGNYSLAREDVTVEIVKADINFEISNASAFNELFFVGATNIPDPETNYVEIGTGYGERTIVWEKRLDGVWSRTLTKDEVVGAAGEYRVRIQYAEGDNYNFGATQYVSFTIKKESVLTIKNIIGPDGNPIAGITDSTLGIKYGENRINMQAQIDGLCEYLTNTANAEKYFIIRVQCGETVIARFERRGVQTMSDLHYVYTYGGMSFDNDRVAGMHFDLFGANEYVSAEGKWIGDEDLEITIEITDSKEHPVLSKDSLQNSSSVGGGQIAVFELQLPEGDDIICTFDVSWSGSPKNIEMVLYDAVTGSETSIVVNKVGENKFTFTETSGRKSFYLYVEELEATNNASGFTITASFETSTTRLEFPEGANELSSGELTYAAGEEKRFVISVGSGITFGMKYTISNIPAGATVKVYSHNGTEVTLSADNSFELLKNVPHRDYTIVVTNTTDSNLNINFSIKREQTSGTIVIS